MAGINFSPDMKNPMEKFNRKPKEVEDRERVTFPRRVACNALDGTLEIGQSKGYM